MKKILTVLLMLGLLVLLLSACADEQREVITQQIDESIATELVQKEEAENNAEIEAVPTPEPSPEPVLDIEPIEMPKVTDDPQAKAISTPTEAQTPTATLTPKPSQTPTPTPRPVQPNETPQASSQTSAPTPQPATEPVQQPISTPQPAPEATPQPTPQPVSPSPPAPEPPPARTICNTCGADITGNVPAHGTMHLLNDENFSYRVE